MVNPQDLLAFAKRAYEQHSQPLKERASILPLGQYEDGSVGMAWPGLLAGPAEAWKRMYDTAASSPVMDDDQLGQMSRDSFDAAGLAMTGGLGAGLAGGLADDALKATVDLPASAAFKFGDEIFDAGQGRYHANAIRDAVAAKGKDAINATWDQNSGFGDMEGFVSLGGNFQTRKQAADAIRSSGKAGDEFIGDELHASTLNDFRSRGLWANAPTGSSVPLAVNALERQPRGMRPTLRRTSDFETVTPDFTPMQLRGMLAASVPDIASEMASSGLSQYRLARSMGDPILESIQQGGALARDVKREALDSWSEAMSSAKRGPTTRFNYDIIGDDGGKMGVATGEVAGDTMFFDWLGDQYFENQNSLGVGGIRALREQVRADFPDVKKFEGLRVSGARSDLDGPQALQSVYIAANAPTGAALPAGMEASQEQDPALLEYMKAIGLY